MRHSWKNGKVCNTCNSAARFQESATLKKMRCLGKKAPHLKKIAPQKIL